MPKTDRLLISAIETLLGNPLLVSNQVFKKAKAKLLATDIPTMLSTWIGTKEIVFAKKLLLAYGHLQALESENTSKILSKSILPSSLESKLPRPRAEYISIVCAAGRAFHALNRIKGNSTPMMNTKAEAWAACFGESLLHALELKQVIIDHDILLFGETGTGKELFGRSILEATPGPKDGSPAPSGALNAAAIPEALVESELFGHTKGSFTGATDTRKGRLRSASGGTFFLDEVGDLPQTTQVKLLRVIETNEVVPVGSDTATSIELRYVAGTHRDLEAMVANGQFRRDLFERLAGNVLRIPPLRDRPGDIVEIGLSFLKSYTQNTVAEHRIKTIEAWLRSDEAQRHRWPGNVRELQNCLRNLMLGLAPGLKKKSHSQNAPDIPKGILNGSSPLDTVEHWYLQKVLFECDNNQNKASRTLGIDRSTLRRKLTKSR